MSHRALLPLSCNTVLCFTDENTISFSYSMESMCCMSNKMLGVGSRYTIQHSRAVCMGLLTPPSVLYYSYSTLLLLHKPRAYKGSHMEKRACM